MIEKIELITYNLICPRCEKINEYQLDGILNRMVNHWAIRCWRCGAVFFVKFKELPKLICVK